MDFFLVNLEFNKGSKFLLLVFWGASIWKAASVFSKYVLWWLYSLKTNRQPNTPQHYILFFFLTWKNNFLRRTLMFCNIHIKTLKSYAQPQNHMQGPVAIPSDLFLLFQQQPGTLPPLSQSPTVAMVAVLPKAQSLHYMNYHSEGIISERTCPHNYFNYIFLGTGTGKTNQACRLFPFVFLLK